MTTWQSLWRLIRFSRWLYLLAGVCWTLSWVLNLAPGLISRAFFDTLTGRSPARIGLYGPVVLLLMLELARGDEPWRHGGGAHLRRGGGLAATEEHVQEHAAVSRRTVRPRVAR